MTPRSRSIIAVAFLGQAFAVGTTIGSFAIFLKPVAETFQASLMQTSLGVSLITLMMGLSGVVIGPLLDRGYIRRIMLTGACLLSAALAAGALTTSLWQLGVLCAVIGIAIPMLGPLTGGALVGKTFGRDRGRALGISNMGIPTGVLLFAMAAGMIIHASGWRQALAFFSIATASVLLPCVAWGIDGPEVMRSTASAQTTASAPHWNRRRLLGNRDFWAAALMLGITAGVGSGWSAHVAHFLMDLGTSTQSSAMWVAVAGGLGIAGALLFGWLSDRIQPQRALLSIVGIQIAIFVLYLTQPPPGVVISGVLVFGMCGGGFMPAYTSLIARRFGPASMGLAMGLSNLFLIPFGMTGPPTAGALRDLFGHYHIGLIVFIAATCLAGTAMLIIRADPQPDD